MSADFLAQMAASSRARVQAARAVCPAEQMLHRARAQSPAPPLRLAPGGFGLIAEVKLRSPAAGSLAESAGDLGARVATYASAGAAAVSVLTEPERFEGSLEHLRAASARLAPLGVPTMRKDFLVDPYQVAEARAAGAGGVLLIVRILEDAELEAMIERARDLALFALLEAFDERDIERLHALSARVGTRGLLAGVNCRDLSTLAVVPERLESLAPLLPRTLPRVAESGVTSAEDARRMGRAGYDLVLVGSALMRACDPLALAATLLDAGREGRRHGLGQDSLIGEAAGPDGVQ